MHVHGCHGCETMLECPRHRRSTEAERRRSSAVCPRCLDIEPGVPGGTPEAPHPGPFTRELCGPCERGD